jgi:ATP-dependent Clp protease ATP-binding subunit ClpA
MFVIKADSKQLVPATACRGFMSVLEAYRSRFDAGGWQVFEGAIQQSRTLGKNYIFSEHIIRELFVEEPDLFNNILQALKVDLETFQTALEQRINSRPQNPDAGIRLDGEVIDMLKGALGRARAQGRLNVSKTDMLVALAHEEHGALLEIFDEIGIDPHQVVKEIGAVAQREDSQIGHAAEGEVPQFCGKGDMIRIRTGAFAAMSARVAEVDPERSLLRVHVNLYGKSKVIELSFSDVEKISFG